MSISHIRLCTNKTPSQNVSENYTKRSKGEAPVVLEFRGLLCTPSLPLRPGPL